MSLADKGDSVQRVDLLVLGASFAGVELLYQLYRRYDRKLTTVVVDRQAAHGYIPLVQERLCGRLAVDDTALDTAAYATSLPHTRFVQAEIVEFSPRTKEVRLASGKRIAGRIVVIALGSAQSPPPSIEGGQRLLTCKLSAPFDAARERLAQVLSGEGDQPHVVVAGGGISGVELAGELAHLDTTRPTGWRTPKVTLVAGGSRLLENLDASVGAKALKALQAQGVTVRLDTRVVAVDDDAVTVKGSAGKEQLPCALAFWGAGVRPAPVLAKLGLPRTEDGWLSVGPSLQCFATADPTHPEIFACGDAVRVEGGQGQWPTMQRAIECLWQAKVVAKNVVRLAKEKPGYPEGIPPMVPHTLRESFPYGVSVGSKSLLVLGGLSMHVPGVTPWFRRFLMRQYILRYTPLPAKP